MKTKIAIMTVCIFILSMFMYSAAESNANDTCIKRLEFLGKKFLRYAEKNDGRMPANLSELYYRAYINNIDAFICPASGIEILHRTEIDAKSSYVISKEARETGVRPIIQDRSADNQAGKGIYAFYSDGSVRLLGSAGSPQPKLKDPVQRKGKAPDVWNAEVEVDWFEDILVARVNGPASPQLKKGEPIPSAVVREIIESVRVVKYRDGISLGSLMDERPELKENIARVVENGDIIEGTDGKATSPTMVIHIPLSSLRAVIFSPESTPPPPHKPQPQLSEDTWQNIREDDSSARGLAGEPLEKKKTPKGHKTGYGF